MSVYIVTDNSGFCKIGVAEDVWKRIDNLQCANPREIVLLRTVDGFSKTYDYMLEKALHDEFEDYRSVMSDGRKTEWFSFKNVLPIIYGSYRDFLRIARAHSLRDRDLLIKDYVDEQSDLKNLGLRSMTLQALQDENINSINALKYRLNQPTCIPGIGEKREQEIEELLCLWENDSRRN